MGNKFKTVAMLVFTFAVAIIIMEFMDGVYSLSAKNTFENKLSSDVTYGELRDIADVEYSKGDVISAVEGSDAIKASAGGDEMAITYYVGNTKVDKNNVREVVAGSNKKIFKAVMTTSTKNNVKAVTSVKFM